MKSAIIAALLGNTKAITIRERLSASTLAEVSGSDETCSTTYDRMKTQAHWTLEDATKGNMHNGKYEDPSFPADNSSLFWSMQEEYQGSQLTYYKSQVKNPGILWQRPTQVTTDWEKGT